MDKVNNSRGHYSSVDKALQAHRQRKAERQQRVEERLTMVRNLSTNFFAPSPATTAPDVIQNSMQNPTMNPMQGMQNSMDQVIIAETMNKPAVESFNPMEMDEIFNEASMASVADNALGIVQKELANPEDIPADEVPKGSYVDYTV